MTIDSLIKVHSAQPFVPFTLHLAYGRKVHVAHPETMLIPGPRARTIVVATPTSDFRLIGTSLIVEIETGNGKHRRRRVG